DKIGQGVPTNIEVTDPSLGQLLSTNQNSIDRLAQTVNAIETRKKTKESANDKKRPEWKQAEQAYYQSFVNNVGSLIMLAKYGYVGVKPRENDALSLPEDKESGRFNLSLASNQAGEHEPVVLAQKAIRSSYDRLRGALPQSLRATVEKREKSVGEKIRREAKESLTSLFQDLNRTIDKNEYKKELYSLDTEKLVISRNLLLQALRFVVAIQNEPVSIKPSVLALGEATSKAIRESLKNIENLTRGKFSPTLQTSLFKIQIASGSKNYKELLLKVKDILKKEDPEKYVQSYLLPARQDDWNSKVKRFSPENKNLLTMFRVSSQRNLMALVFNLLDQQQLLANNLRSQAGWNVDESLFANKKIVVTEAVLGKFNTINNKQEATEPRLCHIQTVKWQKILNKKLDKISKSDIQVADGLDTGKPLYEATSTGGDWGSWLGRTIFGSRQTSTSSPGKKAAPKGEAGLLIRYTFDGKRYKDFITEDKENVKLTFEQEK
ncbi:hypothetical protein KAT92_03820, partial [Candidatus Babeliales bacterium]|nr:hypothetical protein [Candidatus Babeliales bacterium]